MLFKFVTRLGLIALGLLCSGVFILLTLALFPNLISDKQHFIFRESDGDAFHHQPGFVRPPAEDKILEDFIRYSDENGFRRPHREADYYPIIALGDSFTEGGEVPWVDVLAEELDTPVQNLGWRGFGPLQEIEILREYGQGDHKWILLAYFEGNDLSNIHSAYDEQVQNGFMNIDRVSATASEPFHITLSENGEYLYPLEHQIGDLTFELAYISDYIWWLNGEKETYEQSQNIILLRESLLELKTLAQDACVALIYIPIKAHIYFQYADPNGNRAFVLENSLELSLKADSWLGFGDLMRTDYTVLESRFNNQRDVVQALANETDVLFFDLLPIFQETALESPPLYYTYDSHWNRDGHRVAGEAVAYYIRQHAECEF